MKALLSVIFAAAFAATGFNAVAQSKDVTTKSGGAVADKGGTNVTTKDVKEKPKGGELPKIEKKAKKEKPATTEVKTKSGGAVKSADKKDVTSNK
jgi:predicted lipoprotein with Yx(FWY)xxD motif